jgi:hypothetical protein
MTGLSGLLPRTWHDPAAEACRQKLISFEHYVQEVWGQPAIPERSKDVWDRITELWAEFTLDFEQLDTGGLSRDEPRMGPKRARDYPPLPGEY